jgi:hypothetical protein
MFSKTREKHSQTLNFKSQTLNFTQVANFLHSNNTQNARVISRKLHFSLNSGYGTLVTKSTSHLSHVKSPIKKPKKQSQNTSDHLPRSPFPVLKNKIKKGVACPQEDFLFKNIS